MKYETPKMTALTSAINAIQSTSAKSTDYSCLDTFIPHDPTPEQVCGYADWE
jgi:hypothetical protein